MAVAVRNGISLSRHFSMPGIHPYDTVVWASRDALILGEDGRAVFEQRNVEFPASWSQMAVNVVASKYFRGQLGTPQRETSLRELISRVVNQILVWGWDDGYFATKDHAAIFVAELAYLLLHQRAAFNSPVWFNVGIDEKPQASACFILSVEDSMESILEWYRQEGMIFRGGSGAGVNLSNIRGSMELLSGGGRASGPVSFMKAADASAGAIKSGGSTRRAAKLIALNIDHPDIGEFIKCKAKEERKAWALIDAGYENSLDGEAYASVFFQNANNAIRVTDEFMQAVRDDKEWHTRAVTTREIVKTYRARDLLRMIAEAAHACGDPGLQFDTVINAWHTVPNSGRIGASNPCCFVGETLVVMNTHCLTFKALHDKFIEEGRIDKQVSCWDLTQNRSTHANVKSVWIAGHTQNFVDIHIWRGRTIRCTPEHRFLNADGEWIEAKNIKPFDLLQRSRFKKGLPGDSFLQVKGTDKVFLDEPVPVYDMEVEDYHNFVVTNGIIAHNSEFMHLDDTACNLASINLLPFLDTATGEFDVPSYRQAIDILITAQEIMVGHAGYPTPKIEQNSHDFRPLGLNYANLGALLMANGLPYDSDEGRTYAACVTAMLTGRAYRQSAVLAQAMGPFAGYEANREPMLGVIEKHFKAASRIPVSATLQKNAMDDWADAFVLGKEHGYRNAQATVLAPTGTVSFMMEADTTGVEPDIALIKYKKLVGGGTVKIVNQTVPAALARLGYPALEIAAIMAHVETLETIEGAPFLYENDLQVFDCAFRPARGERSISWQGHIKMLGAVQPFISGSISKTVNMPKDATVDDILSAYHLAHEIDIKSIAIYRDGCKRTQPLNTTAQPVEMLALEAKSPVRRRLPDERPAITHKFSIAGHEGYVTVGMFDDGQPGEMFLVMAKEGSTISGMMDAFATAVSVGLQYGVPLKALIEKFSHTRFEPAGFTHNAQIPMAKSIIDYLFRWLATKFLPAEDQVEMGIQEVRVREETVIMNGHVKQEALALWQNQSDAPTCAGCGELMVRNAACYKCLNCGATSGCS